MKKYDTLVRQAISDKYVECSKTKSMVIKQRQLIISKLELEKETLTYREYCELQKKVEQMGKEIEELSIQLNVWDMAREICLNVADDHPTEKVCTGKRCPMQVGYDVKNCKDKDCIYRTEIEKGGVEE